MNSYKNSSVKSNQNPSLYKNSISSNDFITKKDAETNTKNYIGKMSESSSLFQLEELNQLRSELINYQNVTDELKNEVKMKVMLNNNLH